MIDLENFYTHAREKFKAELFQRHADRLALCADDNILSERLLLLEDEYNKLYQYGEGIYTRHFEYHFSNISKSYPKASIEQKIEFAKKDYLIGWGDRANLAAAFSNRTNKDIISDIAEYHAWNEIGFTNHAISDFNTRTNESIHDILSIQNSVKQSVIHSKLNWSVKHELISDFYDLLIAEEFIDDITISIFTNHLTGELVEPKINWKKGLSLLIFMLDNLTLFFSSGLYDDKYKTMLYLPASNHFLNKGKPFTKGVWESTRNANKDKTGQFDPLYKKIERIIDILKKKLSEH